MYVISLFLGLIAALPAGEASTPATRPATQPADRRTASVEWTFQIIPARGTQSVNLVALLPRTLPDRQTVRRMTISPAPTDRFIDGENEYARFDIDPAVPMTIRIAAEIELFRWDLATARLTADRLAADRRAQTRPAGEMISAIPHEALAPWRSPERYIESDSPKILDLARRLPDPRGPTRVPETLQAAHELVLKTLKPAGYIPGDNGALWAIEQGKGDCSEYGDLFIALCRAREIPARAVEGFLITPTPAGDSPKHAWVEAYIRMGRAQPLGWVAFDPYHAAAGRASFEQLAPTRIVTSFRRNDPVLQGHHHFMYTGRGAAAEVIDRFEVKRVE